MNGVNDMMADINKYADIWEKAQKDGIFADVAKKAPQERLGDAFDSTDSADFFGQLHSTEYDMDAPLNEQDVKYWAQVAGYGTTLNEESTVSKDSAKTLANKLGSTFNPVYPNTMGKDQDLGTPVKVTQNWGVGGKELNDLESLKKRLHDLEVNLNKAGIIKEKGAKKKDSDESTLLKSMQDLKKQIDDLSDKLAGNRADEAYYHGDPRRIIAKYPGVDANGRPFKKGEEVTYFPNGKKIISGPEGEQEYRDFLSSKGDEEGMPYSG